MTTLSPLPGCLKESLDQERSLPPTQGPVLFHQEELSEQRGAGGGSVTQSGPTLL